MKSLSVLALLALSASLCFAQVSPREREAENATEARSGIRDSVDVVSGPMVEQVTNHSAVLRWRTNKTAATRVNYGLDPRNLYQHAYRSGGEVDHNVMLRNLRPHTTYYYEIENRYGRNRLTGTFTTQ